MCIEELKIIEQFWQEFCRNKRFNENVIGFMSCNKIFGFWILNEPFYLFNIKLNYMLTSKRIFYYFSYLSHFFITSL